MNELSFDIPATPENKKAMEELKKLSADYPMTVYGDYDGTEPKPIANIERHPDCPVDVYNAFINSLLR